MLNRIIEIHDSGLESLLTDSGQVVLEFSSAYIHQSNGQPGIDPGTGWTQRAALSIRGKVECGALNELPCDLSDGFLILNGKEFHNTIPIPLEQSGDIELRLMSKFAEEIHIKGTNVRLQLLGDPTYIEEFPGSK